MLYRQARDQYWSGKPVGAERTNIARRMRGVAWWLPALGSCWLDWMYDDLRSEATYTAHCELLYMDDIIITYLSLIAKTINSVERFEQGGLMTW